MMASKRDLLSGVGLVVAMASCSGAATPRRADSSDAHKPVAIIPFEFEYGWIIVPIVVDGVGPYRAVLDTAALDGIAAWNESLRRHLDRVRPSEPGGAAPLLPATIGGLSLDIRVHPALRLTERRCFLETMQALRIDAVIGNGLLKRYVVEIDYVNQLLTLFEASGYSHGGEGAALDLVLRAGKPHLLAQVVLDRDTKRFGEFLLDTGASRALVVHSGSVSEGSGVSVLRMGPLEMTEVVTVFEEGSKREGVIGVVGGYVLSRFHVTLDLWRHRMFLRPNERFAEPFETDILGVRFDPCALPGRFLVDAVAPDSPAADAGIRTGDLLVSVDGTSVAQLGYHGIHKIRFGATEQIVSLRLRRNGVDYTVTVRLRKPTKP